MLFLRIVLLLLVFGADRASALVLEFAMIRGGERSFPGSPGARGWVIGDGLVVVNGTPWGEIGCGRVVLHLATMFRPTTSAHRIRSRV